MLKLMDKMQSLKDRASERPNSEDFLQHVKPWCASVWFDLGVLLDVPLHKLKEIKLSGSEDCCMQMFMEWLNSNSDATWNDLLKAVNHILFDTFMISELINEYHEKGRPKLAEVTGFVTPHYAAHWRTIGIQLHVTCGTLDAIEQEYPTNLDWCCDRMLETWLEGDENASWQQLLAIIISFNRKRAVNKKGAEKPTVKECVLLVKPEHMNMWFQLGILLNVPDKKLQDIKLMEQNDSDLCCTRMFMEWENSLEPTWSKLKAAMDHLYISSINTAERPKLSEVLNFVIPQHASQWKQIGLQLELQTGTLEAIETAYPTNCNWCCERMLQKWLEVAINATWKQLFDSVYHSWKANIPDIVQSAIEHLQAEYKETRYVSSKDDWPPDQPKHFTSVALIRHKQRSSKQDVEKVTRHGIRSLKLTNGSYEPVNSQPTKDITQIFKPLESSGLTVPKSILIEGAPGIGKTILCKEIAYQWATKQILIDKLLVILLMLRDPGIQKLKSLFELVEYCCRNLRASKALEQYLYNSQGSNVVIILDGYDEVSKDVRQDSLIADIINCKVLPKRTLVVSSRPVSTAQLHSNMDCRVEILGFTNSDRQKFIQESLKDTPEKIPVLQEYLNENSDISTFCYIPLIMTILLCLFKASIKLPETQTELYHRFICHTIVHFLKKSGNYAYPAKSVTCLSYLPQPHSETIKKLAKISFMLLADDKIVFTANDIRRVCPNLNIDAKGCNELGLLRVTQYFDIEETNLVASYNFLHFSIQEFLAAWYISNLSFPQQITILKQKFWNTRYLNTCIIYMGLTKGRSSAFKYFVSGSVCKFFYSFYARDFNISSRILDEKVKCLHLFQCFLEAKDDNLCALVGSFFEDLIIDLSNQTLFPSDVNILCFYLLRSKNSEWHILNLSGCNIGDNGCSIMHKSLIISGKCNDIFLHLLDLSSNGLTSDSATAIIDLVQSLEVVELNISDNPLQNALVERLCKCRQLKSLITGNDNDSDNRGIKSIINNISQSALEYISIKDSKESTLIFNKGDFKIVSFSSYMSAYSNFVMKNCKITERTQNDLSEFLISQNTLKYISVCNNKFKVPEILSICSTLIEKPCLQEVIISEKSLTSVIVAKITTMLTTFVDLSVMIYSVDELQAINALSTKIIELLAEQPGLTKLSVANCKESNGDLPHVPNTLEIFKFYEDEQGGSIAHFAKAINYASLKIFHVNKASITDDAVNDIVVTLSCNKTLTEFDFSHSILTTKGAINIIEALMNTTNLHVFNICNCGITTEVASSIAVVLKNNCTTLTKVDLSNNKLNNIAGAKIFEALKGSCNLETFKVNGNKMSDKVAENITEIFHNNPRLVEVDVTLNLFTPMIGRSIVIALRNNVSLKTLNVGSCRLTNKVATEVASIIANNPGLTELGLFENHLTPVGAHKIVQALTNIRNLRKLRASKHLIIKTTVHEVTKVLSHNPELVYLDISHNLLTSGLIGSLHSKPLQVLKMSNCKITKAAAEKLGDVLKTAPLVELDLSDNPALAATGIKGLKSAELKTLEVLNLRNCGVDNKASAIRDFIVTLSNLRELDISYNQFTVDGILRIIDALSSTQIQVLKLNGCKMSWSRMEPNEIKGFFSSATNLFHLELSDTDFPISNILNYTSSLKIIDISRCLCVNDEEVKRLSDGISNNQGLQKLDVSHNDLSSVQIANALQNITTLQNFAISNCKIEDKSARFIAAAISHNPQLEELNISWNTLTGIGTMGIIQSLINSSHLQVLKLAACGLTKREAGNLANILSDKTDLKELDLSWNELKAEGINVILKALCTTISLQVLKIDNCNINDKAANEIATNLTKHSALAELDISHNSFTAAGIVIIMKSLKMLSNLKALKLSNCTIDKESSNEVADAIGNNCNLSHFELYHSHFTTAGAALFSQNISNKIYILQILKLVNCGITDKESHEIAAILTSNKTIELLDLSHNPLGEGVTEIVKVLRNNKVIEVLILQSCFISDRAAFGIASIARCTALREFDILHNLLTHKGAFIIAKGFMNSAMLKVLKIKDWSEVFQSDSNTDDNYVLATLQKNKVSLNLE